MIWVCLGLTVYGTFVTILLVRATKRLLQHDQIWQQITDELVDYGTDLTKMSSGGLLVDHPEVVQFHQRNLRALGVIGRAVQAVYDMGYGRRRNRLPRPEVE